MTKTYDGQTARFIASVLTCMPALSGDVMQGWIDNPRGLKKFLLGLVPTEGETKNYQLYFHPKQQKGGRIGGLDLEAHLKDTGRLPRAFGLEDNLVKGWIANPTTYPEEFKGKAVFLWKSAEYCGGRRNAPYLCWNVGRVRVYWHWLGDDWDDNGPALLASA